MEKWNEMEMENEKERMTNKQDCKESLFDVFLKSSVDI